MEKRKKTKRSNSTSRSDKSGTTHVFKKFLEQVNNTPFEAEEGTFACSCAKGAESKDWEQVSEGCENQRWPVAAEVIRPKNSGNQGVVEEVGKNASSLSLRRPRGRA